ncbi:MAG TPA: cytosine permease [Bryobacteraceae bacterium]|nr:cytosine permease [Bryobacteraceae bacterium]
MWRLTGFSLRAVIASLTMLPDYIAKAVPNPSTNRAPWYVNTAPTYAGIFLWVAFYQSLAAGTIDRASLAVCMLALAVAGLLCFALYYYAPAMLGMKTGYPLYVVGSSTFGTTGGYLMPGLLMGVLQIGWFAVGTFFATKFILSGIGSDAQPGSALFTAIAVIWGYTMAYIGAKGIQYVAKTALYLNGISFLMVLIVFMKTMGGIGQHTVDPTKADPFAAFTLLVQAVIGFFATAGAAGADFGMNSRHEGDVRMGGFTGIALAILYAGGLPILSVAGARALDGNISSFSYDAVIASLGGTLASSMFFLFAVASIPSACFCALIAGNSFSTMIPGVKRMSSMMVAVTFAIVLAATGIAADLIGFFTIVGASFGPICGAMTADYILSGKRWAGPREGVSMAGYIAWALGFLVGILPFLPVSEGLKTIAQPAVVYSYITGFVVYAILAKMGLEPKPVPVKETAPIQQRAKAKR